MRPNLTRILGAGVDPAARAFFDRLPSTPVPRQQNRLGRTIRHLRTGGLLAKLDGVYFLDLDFEANALINAAAAEYPLTKVGTITHTPGAGFQGDGISGQLDTGFNPSTAIGAKFQLDSASMGLWSRTSGQSGVADCGTTNSTMLCRNASDAFLGRLNTSGANLSNSNTDGSGLFQVSRVGAGSQISRASDGRVQTNTTASTALDNATIRFCGRGGTLSYSVRQQSFGYFGGGFTVGDMTAMAAIMAEHMASA